MSTKTPKDFLIMLQDRIKEYERAIEEINHTLNTNDYDF
jgi:hypothetical protein